MIPGDLESWHAEWMRIADHNWARGLAAEARRPYPHRDELLPARRRLLPPGRIPSRTDRPAPAADLRENGRLLEEIHRPPQPAGRSGRYSLRRRQADLRLFRARAVSRRQAARADLHGRPRLDQGRDVVHAGAWLPAARHLGADDRRPRPGRHLAPPRHRQPPRHRSADRQVHRLATDARRRRPRSASPFAAPAWAATTPRAPAATNIASPQ